MANEPVSRADIRAYRDERRRASAPCEAAVSNPKSVLPTAGARASHGSNALGTEVSARQASEVRPLRARLGPSPKGAVPLRERCWVSVDEASQVAGEGRTRIYEQIALGKLLTKKAGRRRLVSVASLLEYCGE